MEQRTEEWFDAKRGKASASRVADIMATTKSGPSASRKNYMAALVCERLTGTTAEHFTSTAMQWGTDTEPEARKSYEFEKGVMVEEVGFIEHPTIPNFGASPDGLVDTDGGIEIKCPNTATHLAYLLGGFIDKKYIYQIQTCMMCTGRQWWDFVSYDPRLPEKMALLIRRVPRDETMCNAILSAVKSFNNELDLMIEKLSKIGD